jgi:hypothetical protein
VSRFGRPDPETVRRCLDLAAGPQPRPKISEKAFMAEVIRLAKRNGWRYFHPFDSRRSVAGFPDLVLLRGKTIIVAELKVGDNVLTTDQLDWLGAFTDAGVRAVIWYPGMFEEIGRILADAGTRG